MRFTKSMNHSVGPLQDQHHSASVPDASLIESLPSDSELPRDYNSHNQSNERDLHAFLASELFGPDISNSGAEQESRTLAPLDLTWEQTPGASESYQAVAHTQSPGHTLAEHFDTAGAARPPGDESVGGSGLAQVSLESDPTIHSTETLPRKEKRKAGHGTKGRKRSAQLQEVQSALSHNSELPTKTMSACQLIAECHLTCCRQAKEQYMIS